MSAQRDQQLFRKPDTLSSTSAPIPATNQGRRFVWLPRSPWRRAAFLSVYAAFVCGLLFLGVKLYWSIHAGVPLSETPKVYDAYFPELRQRGVLTSDLRAGDGHFDLLMLGASVIEPPWGSIESQLHTIVGAKFGERGRVWNLAVSGHTTRDSLLKYRKLADKHFDVVLVYDAINDVRMNNCRPGVFREDYSHCVRYHSFERRLQAGKVILDDALEQVTLFGELIELGSAQENLREFGRDIKTPPAYRKNLEEILELTRSRGGRIVLTTFASHIPESYTRDDFDKRRLDYSYLDDDRSCGVELWGEPQAVRDTLAAHNREVRNLAKAYPEALFVDIEAAIPRRGEFFVDPCHLTEAGCQRFVEALRPVFERAMDDWRRTNYHSE